MDFKKQLAPRAPLAQCLITLGTTFSWIALNCSGDTHHPLLSNTLFIMPDRVSCAVRRLNKVNCNFTVSVLHKEHINRHHPKLKGIKKCSVLPIKETLHQIIVLNPDYDNFPIPSSTQPPRRALAFQILLSASLLLLLSWQNNWG